MLNINYVQKYNEVKKLQQIKPLHNIKLLIKWHFKILIIYNEVKKTTFKIRQFRKYQKQIT